MDENEPVTPAAKSGGVFRCSCGHIVRFKDSTAGAYVTCDCGLTYLFTEENPEISIKCSKFG